MSKFIDRNSIIKSTIKDNDFVNGMRNKNVGNKQDLKVPDSENRRLIRLQLKKQRNLIALKLKPGSSTGEFHPKSSPIKFLMNNQAVVVIFLAGFTALMSKKGLIKSVSTVVAVMRVFHSFNLSQARDRT